MLDATCNGARARRRWCDENEKQRGKKEKRKEMSRVSRLRGIFALTFDFLSTDLPLGRLDQQTTREATSIVPFQINMTAEADGTPLQSGYTFWFMRRGKGAAKDKVR